MKPSRAVTLFGTEEMPPEPRVLRAGLLEASLEAGNLRYIRIGGREALRAIAFLVRDRNWGTYNPEISDLEVTSDERGFVVTYKAVCRDASQALAYAARIEGRADGRLVFEADIEALTDFVTNRTGFVVLHALEGVVGAPVTVEHVDGSVVESRFPEQVDPVCPFQNIRALAHELAPGLRVSCRMEGDAFEMEDHRNWMDASYKTYVRPLAQPWPYTIPRGKAQGQRVTLSLEGKPKAGSTAGAGTDAQVRIGNGSGRAMPRMGLAVAPEFVAEALEGAVLLKAARPAYLVCHFDRRKGHDRADVLRFAELGRATGAALVLEAVIACLDAEGKPTDDAAVLARDLREVAEAAAGVSFERVAVSPASDLKCTLPGSVWPRAPGWALLMAEARAAFPGVPVGGGMFSYFTELNRKRPPADLIDFICHTGSPIVHAGDDTSLTETLEALPSIFGSVAAFAGGRPHWVFPTAISMRDNPYGAVPAENPDNIRQAMNRVDPRERGLIGAAWYTGYIARAAGAGPVALTLGAAAGPSGIVYTRQPHAQPWFDEAGARVMPHYFPIAGAGALAGGTLRRVETSDPRNVQAYAATGTGGLRVWLANLSGEPRSVRIEGVDGDATARVLDETSFEALMRDPGAWERRAAPLDGGRLRLEAYTVAEVLA